MTPTNRSFLQTDVFSNNCDPDEKSSARVTRPRDVAALSEPCSTRAGQRNMKCPPLRFERITFAPIISRDMLNSSPVLDVHEGG